MSAQDVPNRLTVLTPDEAGAALLRALVALTEQSGHGLALPGRAGALAVLMAHTAHETGHWHSMHCYNFGNIKAGRRWTGPRCRFEAHELILGQIVISPYYWRAYADAAAGALDYVRYLGSDTDGGGNRYAKAWEAVLAGDPAKFSLELRNAGYYTDRVEVYTRSMVALTSSLSERAKRLAADA